MPVIEFDPRKHRYTVDGDVLPSVTTFLKKIADKSGPLSWWGMKVGVASLDQLVEQGEEIPWGDPDGIVDLLKYRKLTTNHVRDQAGDEGTLIHKAAELYAKEKIVPNPSDFPEHIRGKVRALARWFGDYHPEVLASEVQVASLTHRYAGTYDLRVQIGDRTGLVDLKTSKSVYAEFFIQLALYEVACVECGYDPTDFRSVLHLMPDGEYAYIESPEVDVEGLLAGRRWYDALTAAEKAWTQKKKRIKEAA